jgi:hypothetical protein
MGAGRCIEANVPEEHFRLLAKQSHLALYNCKFRLVTVKPIKERSGSRGASGIMRSHGKISTGGLAQTHHSNINMAAFKKNQLGSFQNRQSGNNLLSGTKNRSLSSTGRKDYESPNHQSRHKVEV